MKALYCFIVLSCFYIKNHAQDMPLKLTESQGILVIIDGVMDEQEWLNAKVLTITGVSNHEVTVLITYDTDNLYVAFKNLSDSNSINYNAEVLIHTSMEDLTWNDQCYWFHSSYGNCAAIGQYFYWDDCTSQPMGWMANTFPFKDGNNTIEFKISLTKLNITPEQGQQLKIAFKISNPLEQHAYWPETATIANPVTWGSIRFN